MSDESDSVPESDSSILSDKLFPLSLAFASAASAFAFAFAAFIVIRDYLFCSLSSSFVSTLIGARSSSVTKVVLYVSILFAAACCAKGSSKSRDVFGARIDCLGAKLGGLTFSVTGGATVLRFCNFSFGIVIGDSSRSTDRLFSYLLLY